MKHNRVYAKKNAKTKSKQQTLCTSGLRIKRRKFGYGSTVQFSLIHVSLSNQLAVVKFDDLCKFDSFSNSRIACWSDNLQKCNVRHAHYSNKSIKERL